MKIALIAPPYPLEEAPSPPLGICYVAAACEAAGAEVRIIDYIVGQYTPKKLVAQLDAFRPDLVGVTCVTLNFPAAADIIQTVKQHDPSITTVMGGPHVSFCAEETLRRFPEIDAIVLGEAEHTLHKWLPQVQDRLKWPEIKGLAFMDSGHFVTTGPGEFITDLDALPLPARHLLPLSKYQALGFPISIITSRGCPNQCIFCLGRRMVGSRVRYRDPVRVVDEIESILAYGFSRINIADDLFTANKRRVKKLCEEILSRKISFGWSAFARVDTVDEETLHIMKAAGCDGISFGIESGNPEMLKRVKKRISLDQARQAVALCKRMGILAHASFMVGLPGETRETLNDTLNFSRELSIDHGFHFLSPFPGTTLREELFRYDLEILTDDWTRYDANSAIVRTAGLTPEEMDQFVADAYRPLLDRWADTKRRVAEGKCTEQERLEVESADRLNLIFSILSNDIIEEEGSFSSADREPTAVLIHRIAAKTGFDEAVVQRYIEDWVRFRYLSHTVDHAKIRWFWTPKDRPVRAA